jgi:uncharacterized protein YjiS (DUF1127 family)
MAAAAPLRRDPINSWIDIAAVRPGSAPLPPETPNAGILTRVAQWLDRQRQRAILATLEDRLLADIGVTRAEALHESRRWS